VTSTKSAVLLAISALLAVVAVFVLADAGLLVAYPAWLYSGVFLWLPVLSLLLAIGSLILAATTLRGGIRVGRLMILGTALIETLWTAMFVSFMVNIAVCNHPCLIPVTPPGL
jgi:hypothetical protein